MRVDGDVGAFDEFDTDPVWVENIERALANDVPAGQVLGPSERHVLAGDQVGVRGIGAVDGEGEMLLCQITPWVSRFEHGQDGVAYVEKGAGTVVTGIAVVRAG